jgi:hypothetical protein
VRIVTLLGELSMLGLLWVLTAVEPAAAAQPPARIRVDREIELATIRFALDLAWTSGRTVAVAAGTEGVVEVDTVERKERVLIRASGGSPRSSEGAAKSIWAAFRIAVEGDLVAVSAPAAAFAWRSGRGELWQTSFADVRDFDLLGGRAIILGVRGDGGKWGRPVPGPTLWSLALKGSSPRTSPVEGGPEPRKLAACMMTLNSAVVRMPNGTVVIAPGVEPGLHLYDGRGRKIRSWETAQLGFHDRCDISEEMGLLMRGNAKIRFDWLNRRDTLEDVIATEHGPLLIIRHPTPSGTSWRGVLLPFSGKPTTVSIPVTSSSSNAQLRAASRGRNVALAVYDFPLTGPGERTLPSRLIVGELTK